MSFEEEIYNSQTKLNMVKEAFIIEELRPYFEDGELKQKLLLRLQEKKDWEQHVRKIIYLLGQVKSVDGEVFEHNTSIEVGVLLQELGL